MCVHLRVAQSTLRLTLLEGVFDNIPFAGGEGENTAFSLLNGTHSIGEGILGFLTILESNALRGVCREFREAVMDFPWMGEKSHIKGSLMAWCMFFFISAR